MNKGCYVHALCKMLLLWAEIGKTTAYFLRFDIKLSYEIPFWVRFGYGSHLKSTSHLACLAM